LKYPTTRLRRLRSSQGLRNLISETHVPLSSLVMPYFVSEGKGVRQPIASLENQYRYSVDTLLKELSTLVKLGIRSILLFGIPKTKSANGNEAYSANGITQKAIRKIKKEFPEIVVIADTCLCAYTSHGHCGIVSDHKVLNDKSVQLIAKTALTQAEAGADMVAPSDMMDGRVAAIRRLLDQKGFEDTPILSYAAKYTSAFYGPFREAQHSTPQFGDRKTYQMNHSNREEALREIRSDIDEGADIVMIKPALAYLDIIREAKDKFNCPLAAYNVSGEYAMVKQSAKMGLIDEKSVVLEIATSIRRAGADILISYHAKDIAKWLKESR